jgi:Exostosin family
MAKVLLRSLFPDAANSWYRSAFDAFVHSAKNSSHQLVSDPEEADIIFLTDEGIHPITDSFSNPWYQQYWYKCFIFAQNDFPVSLVPGLYASIKKSEYDHGWCRSGFYAWDCPSESSHIVFTRYDQIPFPKDPQYLCSFAGSCQNARIREKLKELQHPRYRIVDVNRDTITANTTGDREWISRLQNQYKTLIGNSKFSLCPRGHGCNSFRLYESMAMGRAPVILSDDWVAPPEIPWDEFSIRIAEKDYQTIFKILEQQEDRAERLGQRGREVWERYFHPNKIFDHAVDIFLDIRSLGKTAKRSQHRLRMARVFPKIAKLKLQSVKSRLLKQ